MEYVVQKMTIVQSLHDGVLIWIKAVSRLAEQRKQSSLQLQALPSLTAGLHCSQLAGSGKTRMVLHCSSRTQVWCTADLILVFGADFCLCNVQDVGEQLQHLQLRYAASEELPFTGLVLLARSCSSGFLTFQAAAALPAEPALGVDAGDQQLTSTNHTLVRIVLLHAWCCLVADRVLE
jgi:hypothetical protein